ncbi:FAD:protein FMN transferase, partial [Acinetobacter baumannii]
ETAREMEVESGLFSIDGELRALGAKPDGSGWAVGIEAPDMTTRAAESIIELTDAAVATSGTYRHCREVAGRTVHHTIDPRAGEPSASGI